MKGHGVIKPEGNCSGCEGLGVGWFEVSSMRGSFVAEDLLPKSLLNNLLPLCFMVGVPDPEDDLEETLGRSITSMLVTIDAIVVNTPQLSRFSVFHFEELELVEV